MYCAPALSAQEASERSPGGKPTGNDNAHQASTCGQDLDAFEEKSLFFDKILRNYITDIVSPSLLSRT